jgi:hypothetical protein
MTVQSLIVKSPEKIQRGFLRSIEKPSGAAMPLRKHVPDEARELLDASGLDWTVRSGSRHFKVIIEGRFATIIPHSKPASRVKSRAHMNMLSHIRRTIRSLQQ